MADLGVPAHLSLDRIQESFIGVDQLGVGIFFL